MAASGWLDTAIKLTSATRRDSAQPMCRELRQRADGGTLRVTDGSAHGGDRLVVTSGALGSGTPGCATAGGRRYTGNLDRRQRYRVGASRRHAPWSASNGDYSVGRLHRRMRFTRASRYTADCQRPPVPDAVYLTRVATSVLIVRRPCKRLARTSSDMTSAADDAYAQTRWGIYPHSSHTPSATHKLSAVSPTYDSGDDKVYVTELAAKPLSDLKAEKTDATQTHTVT
jgi:hypothetical protein